LSHCLMSPSPRNRNMAVQVSVALGDIAIQKKGLDIQKGRLYLAAGPSKLSTVAATANGL